MRRTFRTEVAPVISTEELDEAIAIANSCRLGLCCSVFTRQP